MNHCIKHPELAEEGQQILNRTILNMPVLDLISLRFQNLHPFEGLKISMCQHLTAETAALAVTLKQGGAEIYMAASNPRSTQEAVVAVLVNITASMFLPTLTKPRRNIWPIWMRF